MVDAITVNVEFGTDMPSSDIHGCMCHVINVAGWVLKFRYGLDTIVESVTVTFA